MISTSINDCRVISLPTIGSSRLGVITPIYNNIHIPFSIKRVYYLYDVPAGSKRGGHSHKDLNQLIVAASGSFEVVVDDGETKRSFVLTRPSEGLYIPSMIWRELFNFSGGSICLVLASNEYDEDDYYRDYNLFIKDKKIRC